jgi:hypothetical protein
MVGVDRITRITLMNGVYDSELDSIDIAIFGSEFAAAELFGLTSFCLGFAYLKWVGNLGIDVLTLAALRSFVAAFYWTRPDHGWIVAAPVLAFLMCGYWLPCSGVAHSIIRFEYSENQSKFSNESCAN